MTNKRLNNFDVLRLSLALLVLVSHSFLLLAPFEPLSYITLGQLEGGELAVNAFFVLSGYLITKSWLASRTQWDYFRKRVLRIYPGYLAAVFFSIAVVGPLAANSVRDYWAEIHPLGALKNALLLNGVLAPRVFSEQRFTYMNGSLWTIYYEFMCYIAVAVVGGVGALRRLGWLAPALIFGVSWLLLLSGAVTTEPATHWVRFAVYFSAGSLCSFAPPSIFSSNRLAGLAAGLLGIGLGLGFLRLVMPWAGAYLLFWAAQWRPAKVPHPPLDISYGVYLYAYPVQQLLIHFGVHTPWLLCLASVPISLLLGFLSWHWVERPFLSLKAKVRE